MKEQFSVAKSILDLSFISPDEIVGSTQKIVYTEAQLRFLWETFPSVEVIQWGADNDYMLFPGPCKPMFIADIHLSWPEYFKDQDDILYFKDDNNHQDTISTRWVMLRKNLIPGSLGKNFDEQRQMLSADETIPNVATVAWGLAMSKSVRNLYLLPDKTVRTSSVYRGTHYSIGKFLPRGMSVLPAFDSRYYMGIVAERIL